MRKAHSGGKNGQNEPFYKCRDCANSYDWNSKALDGHLILCRCPYKMEGGKYCIFLNDKACKEHFKLRTDNAETDK